MNAPLVQSTTFIRATRDSGYLTTGHAVAELIDNSLQASATAVDVIVRNHELDGALMLAVVDNGVGMRAGEMTLALQFGGSTRFDDRRGPGRFGMGLPNASVSQARRVDLYSWSPETGPLHTFLDADDVSSGALSGVPSPTPASVPESLRPTTGATGTAVMWTKCDRIPYKRPGMLVRHLAKELGRIFRRFLASGLTLRLNGEQLVGVDVLKRDGIPESDARPIRFPLLEFPFACEASPNGRSVVQVEFVLLPIREWSPLPNDVKRVHGISGAANVSILRANREIAYGWLLMGGKRRENYDDWWRCEISFDPYLDDLFGVVHNKQGIRPARILLDALGPSLEAQARKLNRQVRDLFVGLRVESRSSTAIATRGHNKIMPRQPSPTSPNAHPWRPAFSSPQYVLQARGSDSPSFFSSYRCLGRLYVDLNSNHPIYRRLYTPLGNRASDLATRFELIVLALARVLEESDHEDAAALKRLVETWSDVAAVLLEEVR